MIISAGTKKMFEVWYERAHGFSPKKEIAKIKRETAKILAKQKAMMLEFSESECQAFLQKLEKSEHEVIIQEFAERKAKHEALLLKFADDKAKQKALLRKFAKVEYDQIDIRVNFAECKEEYEASLREFDEYEAEHEAFLRGFAERKAKNESASRESDKRVAEIREAAEREAAIHEAASIQEKENTIYNLYSNGVSIPIIAIAMGVTEEFVEEVSAKRKQKLAHCCIKNCN